MSLPNASINHLICKRFRAKCREKLFSTFLREELREISVICIQSDEGCVLENSFWSMNPRKSHLEVSWNLLFQEKLNKPVLGESTLSFLSTKWTIWCISCACNPVQEMRLKQIAWKNSPEMSWKNWITFSSGENCTAIGVGNLLSRALQPTGVCSLQLRDCGKRDLLSSFLNLKSISCSCIYVWVWRSSEEEHDW